MTALTVVDTAGVFWSGPQIQPPALGAGKNSQMMDNKLIGLSNRGSVSDGRDLSDLGTVDYAEKLYNNRVELKIVFSKVSMHIAKTWRDKLFKKIDAILDPEAWVEGDVLIQSTSFITFLRLILESGPKGKMSLGVSDEGNLLAGWIATGDQLSLEFLPKDEVLWNVVVSIDNKLEYASGRANIRRLNTILSAYTPEKWFGVDDTTKVKVG